MPTVNTRVRARRESSRLLVDRDLPPELFRDDLSLSLSGLSIIRSRAVDRDVTVVTYFYSPVALHTWRDRWLKHLEHAGYYGYVIPAFSVAT